MRYITIFLLFIFLTSCGSTVSNTSTTTSTDTETTETQVEKFDEKDIDFDLKNSETIYIELDSENTTTTDETSIQIIGQDITIKKSGNYEFSGELIDGQIIIETEDEKNVQIILNGVEITNNDGPTIFIKSTSQAVITLADGSDNKLVDGNSYNESDEGENANIYSKEDLVIIGDGSLEVIGNYNDAITSKDKLYIGSGDIKVTAIDDGIRGKDYLLIEGGNIDIKAEGDAIKSDNEEEATIYITGGDITISAGDDAIHSELYIVIDDGDITIKEAYEGIEAQYITVNNGNLDITVSDDGFNAAGGSASIGETIANLGSKMMGEKGSSGNYTLNINGGDIYINASGDSLDSNTDVNMTGGNVIVQGTEHGGSSLDYDGSFIVTGGELIATGNGGMAKAPSTTSTQNGFFINLDTTGEAGTIFSIKDKEGINIISIDTIRAYEYITGSSSKLVTGETYYYYIDDEKIGEITISDMITTIGEIESGKGDKKR